MSYAVFTRTFWKPATRPGWPNGRMPALGRKSRKGHPQRLATEEEARNYCKAWNATHEQGPMSRKAEFEEN